MKVSSVLLCICRLFVITLIVGLVGCSSYGSVEQVDSPTRYDISVGDKVKIITTSRQSYEFQVIEINDDAVVGKNIEIPLKEISYVQKLEFDEDKTAAAIATTLGVGFLIYLTVGSVAFLLLLASM